MYQKILENLEKQLPDNELKQFKRQNLHLGIFTEPYLTYMLEGKKTIEARFSNKKLAPYKQITKKDIVLIKKASGNVIGYFTIKDIEFLETAEVPLAQIREKYNDKLCLNDLFWKLKRHSNYATLITIDKLVQFEPFSIGKTGRLGWIKLKKEGEKNECTNRNKKSR